MPTVGRKVGGREVGDCASLPILFARHQERPCFWWGRNRVSEGWFLIVTMARALNFRVVPVFVHVAALLGVLIGVLLPGLAQASPVLRCQLGYGGAIRVVDFLPVSNPYRVEAVDVDERFRFKAVVIGNERQLDRVSLYAYYHAEQQAVLLHQATYQAPAAQVAPAPNQLTGMNYLYSPDLERELQYACAVYEVAR